MSLAVGKDLGRSTTSTGGKLYRYDTALKRFINMGIAMPAGVSRWTLWASIRAIASGRYREPDKMWNTQETWVTRMTGS
ncbi:MAG: hypothetical protein U5O16_01740 [Rhodococcus sp. (in: high G+C Gram-positive bacteria)]|uniref:hypothetical protein n=1 Tax=Rhodococcus sp. TaxID=1831 RepID=UPI002ADC41B8|nr:hypothetical protein [Rhodococcus sp. (in: high G+C Gram-positive bacteria)]